MELFVYGLLAGVVLAYLTLGLPIGALAWARERRDGEGLGVALFVFLVVWLAWWWIVRSATYQRIEGADHDGGNVAG